MHQAIQQQVSSVICGSHVIACLLQDQSLALSRGYCCNGKQEELCHLDSAVPGVIDACLSKVESRGLSEVGLCELGACLSVMS
jgi:hypothetical protein